MAYIVASTKEWAYWHAGSKPRAFKSGPSGIVEFETWEDMAKELELLGIKHPWAESAGENNESHNDLHNS